MSKEAVINLVNLIPDEDIETIYKVLVKFIPENKPLPDEIEAIERGKHEYENGEYVSMDEINWD